MKFTSNFLIFLLLSFTGLSQVLHPGFSKDEYISLLKISAKQVEQPLDKNGMPDSAGFQRVYKSHEMGLQNQWDLWANKKGVAVISIRGTTADFVSWLANFYAAMVPAKEVRAGRIYAVNSHHCAIDTLLSGAYPTVADAVAETNRRRKLMRLDVDEEA